MSIVIQSLIGLAGVVIGGLISYFSQTKNQERIEKRNDQRQQEIQKMKDTRQKHIAYNQFLLLEGTKSPLIHPINHENETNFRWSTYVNGTRNILYDNLHLFDQKIVQSVLEIDLIGEEASRIGVEMEHLIETYELYSEIKKNIEVDYQRDIVS